MKIHIVITTFGNINDANIIKNFLLKYNLASCIQIETIESSYIWGNNINNETEYKMSIKTTKKHIKRVKNEILSRHPYEIPEILILEAKTTKPYFKWHKNTINP